MTNKPISKLFLFVFHEVIKTVFPIKNEQLCHIKSALIICPVSSYLYKVSTSDAQYLKFINFIFQGYI